MISMGFLQNLFDRLWKNSVPYALLDAVETLLHVSHGLQVKERIAEGAEDEMVLIHFGFEECFFLWIEFREDESDFVGHCVIGIE